MIFNGVYNNWRMEFNDFDANNVYRDARDDPSDPAGHARLWVRPWGFGESKIAVTLYSKFDRDKKWFEKWGIKWRSRGEKGLPRPPWDAHYKLTTGIKITTTNFLQGPLWRAKIYMLSAFRPSKDADWIPENYYMYPGQEEIYLSGVASNVPRTKTNHVRYFSLTPTVAANQQPQIAFTVFVVLQAPQTRGQFIVTVNLFDPWDENEPLTWGTRYIVAPKDTLLNFNETFTSLEHRFG